MIVPGDQVLEYKLCTVDDPYAVILLPSFGRGYVEIVSCLIHIFIYTWIFIFKNKNKSKVGPDEYVHFLKKIMIIKIEKQSLTDL